VKFFAHRAENPDGRYRPRDTANAIGSLKACIDGFVDAGLVPDDSHKWISWGTVDIYRDKKTVEKMGGGKPRVEITLEQTT
jgi:hypothetical protein